MSKQRLIGAGAILLLLLAILAVSMIGSSPTPNEPNAIKPTAGQLERESRVPTEPAKPADPREEPPPPPVPNGPDLVAAQGTGPEIGVAAYVTDEMLVTDEAGLKRGNATTVLGLEFTNASAVDVTLAQLTLGFERISGQMPKSGEIGVIVYRDVDGNGVLIDQGYAAWQEGEGALTAEISAGQIHGNQGRPKESQFAFTLQAAPTLGVFAIVPATGSLKLAVELWNHDARDCVLDISFGEARGTTAAGDPVLIPAPEPPPSNRPTLIGQESDCKLECTSGAFHLCVVPDLTWTDGDDAQVNANCGKDQAPVQWQSECAISNEKIVERTRVQDISISATANSISATLEPTSISAACDDASIVVEATLTHPITGVKVEKARGVCHGTVFEIRVFPVIPSRAERTSELEKQIEQENGGDIPAGLQAAFASPTGEMPNKPGSKTAPITRVDPALIFDGPDGADLKVAANRILAGLRVPDFMWECVLTGSTHVCADADAELGGAVAFQFQVLPDDCPADAMPKLTVSQFDNTGQFVGRLAIINNGNDLDAGGKFFTDSSNSNTTELADGTTDIAANGLSVTNIASGSFIYLRPIPAKDGNGQPILEYCNLVSFTACERPRPIAMLRVCAMPVKTIELCFHFFAGDATFNNPAKRKKLVENFVLAANELLGQCCIQVRVHSFANQQGASTHTVIQPPVGGPLAQSSINMADSAVTGAIRQLRQCHGTSTLNIFLFPGTLTDGSAKTILGATVASERTDGGDINRPDQGTYQPPVSLDAPGTTIDRFVVIPLGLFPGASGNLESLFKGSRIAFAEVFSHELGHALGLLHTDGGQLIMRENAHEPDLTAPPPNPDDPPKLAVRMRDPSYQRFSMAECEIMRRHLDELGQNWSFTR